MELQHMNLHELRRQSEWFRIMEGFRKLEDVLRREADKKLNGKLTREEAAAVIKKTDFFGKEKHSSEEILNRLKNDAELYAGGKDIFAGGTKDDFVEIPLNSPCIDEVTADYMKKCITDTKTTPNPQGFTEFAKNHAQTLPDGSPDKTALVSVVSNMENYREKFEKKQRIVFEEWLVTTLSNKNSNDAEYSAALDYLKYREADTLQFKVETNEQGKPVNVSFMLKVKEAEVADKYSNENDEFAKIKSVTADRKNFDEAKTDDVREISKAEHDKWQTLYGKGENVRDLLYALRDRGKQNSEQTRAPENNNLK